MFDKIMVPPKWFEEEMEDASRIAKELNEKLNNESDLEKRLLYFLSLPEDQKLEYDLKRQYYESKLRYMWDKFRYENRDKPEIALGVLQWDKWEKVIKIKRRGWKKHLKELREQWNLLRESLKNENKNKKL